MSSLLLVRVSMSAGLLFLRGGALDAYAPIGLNDISLASVAGSPDVAAGIMTFVGTYVLGDSIPTVLPVLSCMKVALS